MKPSKTADEKEFSEDPDIKALVESIHRMYGYDFKDYAEASFKRTLLRAAEKHKCKDIHDLLHRILTDANFFTLLLRDLTITVTELFRDPPVYKAIREKVVPYLKTYPEIKIWFAGCANGDEVYSTAIMLKEEGLLERCLLYGTDVNPVALKRAKEGIIPPDHAKEAAARYAEAGGKASLEDYYTEDLRALVLNGNLKKRMVFSDHNLATDGVFGEMQLIFCRNVLIYFKRPLHNRAIQLFANSLCSSGFLCLGSKETLNFSAYRDQFDEFLKDERIYKRNRSQAIGGSK